MVDLTPKRDTTRRREESPRNRDRHGASKSKDDGKEVRTHGQPRLEAG